MSSSILNSTKKVLGLAEDDTSFDLDILMHINSVFSTLEQLGVGPQGGFMIEDAAASWDSFLGADSRLNSVKSYIYMKVRLLFDPPGTSFTIAAFEAQCKELEWRLNVIVENDKVNLIPVIVVPADYVLDGGEGF